MGRQFRMFALPSDLEAILAEIRAKYGVRILADAAPSTLLLELENPYRHWKQSDETVQSIHEYLAPPRGGDLRQWYAAKRSEWLIDSKSEVIQISGFDFYPESKLLIQGRFYFEKDFVVGDSSAGYSLVSKSEEFLRWADQVFRTAKKGLRYSKHLMAYVGKDADQWQKSVGRFAYRLGVCGKIVYADEPSEN